MADILGKFGQFVGLFLHQGMLSGLFGESLQLIALGLVFFAEVSGLLLSGVVPVVVGLVAELCGGGCVFTELFGHCLQVINELLVCLSKSLLSECGGVIANADGPWAFPNDLGAGNLSFVGCANLELDSVALPDIKSFEVDAEVVGNFESAMVEWDGGDYAGGVLIFSKVQFEESDADVVSNETVERNDVIGADFEAVCETGDDEDGWGVGRDDESAFGFALVLEAIFVSGDKVEFAAAECGEFKDSGESIGGDSNVWNNWLWCRIGGCRGFCCTGHSCTGCGGGEFFRELAGRSLGIRECCGGGRHDGLDGVREWFPVEPFELQLVDGLAESQLNFDIAAFEDSDITDGPVNDLDWVIGPLWRSFCEGCSEDSWRVSDDELVPWGCSAVASDAVFE